MPRIFDNIELPLLPALQETLPLSQKSDFCVGYFNLRGWRLIDKYLDHFSGGDNNICRVLVGMQRLTQDDMHLLYNLVDGESVTQGQSEAFKKKMAEDFREQLASGAPTNADEQGLRYLAAQIRNKKVVVKLFFRHTLHAKLYLLYRTDPNNPIVGFLGSSNLTLSGLSKQGELNVDVLDHDACRKLEKWFNDRWNDRFCIDISDMLASIIENSWARESQIPPYHIYLKIAYHLSQDAIAGLNEFKVPSDFLQNTNQKLFQFQTIAVQIAARYLYKRNGVLIGDVVGLGKTLMAAALCRIFQDDYHTETLIICPKNLKKMWQHYKHTYRIACDIVSVNEINEEFIKKTPRYRVVLIDESHNFRNREGKRFKAIQEYIAKNDSRCILLSATPYNKTYLDLSGQLRLFIDETDDLGIRPEKKIKEIGEIEFERQHQCKPHSIAAFEKSEYADDWRELMRLYMVRRTRSFIMDYYAEKDINTGRKYLQLADGTKSFFPDRIPKTIKFEVSEHDKSDPYARLFASEVVDVINHLELPRYGLGNYIAPRPKSAATQAEAKILAGLSRAGKRLMGFCRTNLFKRLESGGPTFIQSVERHILRNYVFVYAIENKLEIPLGTQDSEMLDSRINDEDDNSLCSILFDSEDTDDSTCKEDIENLFSEAQFKNRSEVIYKEYQSIFKNRFKWIRSDLFISELSENLLTDAKEFLKLLTGFGEWKQENDTKLDSLYQLLVKKHKNEKVLIFTQFADTVAYLVASLKKRGLTKIEGVSGATDDPSKSVWRFSPISNEKNILTAPDYVASHDELRVLVTTDVLSEGQNLQDCYIVVNYDLPWAIIRLIQRAGRVDRIGQQSNKIWCYSFLPADGIERIIRLRNRVRQRLHENAEVVGADESFFEDFDEQKILNLYHEKSGILDDEKDNDVDPSSYAYQIWKNAIDKNPSIRRTIEDLPNVVYSAKEHLPTAAKPEGALIYMRTAHGNDSLVWVNKKGEIASESGLAVLEAAKCEPDTPFVLRDEKHHELVNAGAKHVLAMEKVVGGSLGSPRGARFKTYERLKEYLRNIGDNRDLFISEEFIRSLDKVIDDIHGYHLQNSAIDTLNRVIKSGISDFDLAHKVIQLREEERLSDKSELNKSKQAQIICSMGLNAVDRSI
jgi:superfamily II DNA or RNA helicase